MEIGSRALGLAANHLWEPPCQAHLRQLHEPFPNAVKPVSATERNKYPVWNLASELKEDLEGDGLEALDAIRICTSIERINGTTGKPPAASNQPFQHSFPIAAAQDPGAIELHQGCLQNGNPLMTENRGFQASSTSVGGVRAAMVARTYGGCALEAQFSGHR